MRVLSPLRSDLPYSCYYSFREHHQQMSSMMRGFHDPFSHFGFPSALPGIENGRRAGRSSHDSQQLAQPTDMFGSMFGNMFANMNSMMANMHRNFVSLFRKQHVLYHSSWNLTRSWYGCHEFRDDPWNPVKFPKAQNTAKFTRNFTKYMSAQHIWNLSWLLGLFTYCKLANLLWNCYCNK